MSHLRRRTTLTTNRLPIADVSVAVIARAVADRLGDEWTTIARDWGSLAKLTHRAPGYPNTAFQLGVDQLDEGGLHLTSLDAIHSPTIYEERDYRTVADIADAITRDITRLLPHHGS
ncbi:hypothetical protein [Streptomyces sp. NPDC059708]|uniref:hypothetical protein n=1 Tax=Streptomyces sp. NPDC059708 TaxID=3346916 RepID=UPI00369D0DE0